VTDFEHTPLRPSWLCVVDGKPWPCDDGWLEMEAWDPVELAIFMSLMLYEAVKDLPNTLPRELYERFIARTWTAPAAPH